ncbi:hypothetical protein MKX01_014434 [Papaver californicum]|nr:hypothetical protein MKX01_014434 [Papaver californicum]
MGSSENDVPVPAVPVNEPLFSIRDYVLAARDKNITCNWPFPEKYLQTCMIRGVSKVLPPFDCHISVKNILCRKEKKSDIGSILKKCVGLDRGKEITEVNCNISTLNTSPRSNKELEEHCLTAVASCSKRLNSNGQEENLICVKEGKSDIAPVNYNCVGHDCKEEIIEANDNVSASNSNPRSNIEEENSSGVNMKSDIGSVQKHSVGLYRREEIIEVNCDVDATLNLNPKSNKEENSDCVKDDKSDTGAVTFVGLDCKEIIGFNGNVSTSNSNPRSNIEENSSCVKDMESDTGSLQKNCVGVDRREDTFEVNGFVSATSNSILKSNRYQNSDCIKDDKFDTGAITCVGHDCKEIIEADGNVSPSDSNPRSNIEENSSCVKKMKFDIGSIQKNCVGLDRKEDIFEVNGVVCATSNSNLKSNRDQNSDCIKDVKSDTGAITCVGHDCKEIIEANGNISTSDSNPRSNLEGNSNCVKDDKSDTGAINFVGVDCEEEITEVNGFNHEEETIEVNSNVNTTSNSNPKSSEEMDEQCLKAAASCSKRLNSKLKKRKRKAKKRLVADVVADAKPCTLEELDKIKGSNWAIDQHVIYRRITSRIKDEDEVYGTKETTAINNIPETRSAEWLPKMRQHRKDNNTAEDDSNVVKKRPAPVVKLKLRKPQSSTVEVNTPIKSDSKSKPVATRSQVKRSLPSVNGISTIIRRKRRGKS